MKKVFLSILVLVLIVTMVLPSNMVAGASQPLADIEMSHIAGGSIATCGSYDGIVCCCIDLWIFSLCVCISIA